MEEAKEEEEEEEEETRKWRCTWRTAHMS